MSMRLRVAPVSDSRNVMLARFTALCRAMLPFLLFGWPGVQRQTAFGLLLGPLHVGVLWWQESRGI